MTTFINISDNSTLSALQAALVATPHDEVLHSAYSDCLSDYGEPRQDDLYRLHRRLLNGDYSVQEELWSIIESGVTPSVPVYNLSIGSGQFIIFHYVTPNPLDEKSKGFWMSKYPITQEQYLQVTGSNPSHFKGKNLPVERVTWDDSANFCNRIGARLPTEFEWEYACRAGTNTEYYSGNTEEDLDKVGWYRKNSNDKTHPVGQKLPNAFGLYDLHGNVWEWTSSLYSTNQSYRVGRGGSWNGVPWLCRSPFRFWSATDFRYHTFGFRCVLDKIPN